jgi:hypothetical protein
VPGHGPLATVADLAVLRDHLNWLEAHAARAVYAGAGPEEALATLDPGPVGDWLEPERTGQNLRAAMAAAGVRRR